MNFDAHQELGRSAALAAAIESGLLASLCRRSDSPAGHARVLGLDARATALVLDLLVAVGAAHRSGDLYEAAPALRAADRSSPGGIEFLETLWRQVPTFLRTGEPLVRMDGDAEAREAAYSPTVAKLAVLFSDAATELAAAIGGSPRTILDVGAGSGVWSLQMARRDPSARVTGLDLPGVLDRFHEHAQQLGLADRVSVIAGDFHDVEVPEAAFDRVVLANVVHLEPSDRAARLVARARGWVRPGGELVVVDALQKVPSEDVGIAVYAIHLSLRTGSGRVHGREEVEAWARAAGLSPRFVPLYAGPGKLGAVVATAP